MNWESYGPEKSRMEQDSPGMLVYRMCSTSSHPSAPSLLDIARNKSLPHYYYSSLTVLLVASSSIQIPWHSPGGHLIQTGRTTPLATVSHLIRVICSRATSSYPTRIDCARSDLRLGVYSATRNTRTQESERRRGGNQTPPKFGYAEIIHYTQQKRGELGQIGNQWSRRGFQKESRIGSSRKGSSRKGKEQSKLCLLPSRLESLVELTSEWKERCVSPFTVAHILLH